MGGCLIRGPCSLGVSDAADLEECSRSSKQQHRCCPPPPPPCLLCLQVAEGSAHVYPRLAPTCEWDTAAAHIIVTEAGGEVLQAGLCDSKGTLLEDWKVGGRVDGCCRLGGCWWRWVLGGWRALARLVRAAAALPPPCPALPCSHVKPSLLSKTMPCLPAGGACQGGACAVQ
jgi:hypothetical protein